MLTKNYWEERYQEDRTGWDLGEVSPPLKGYFDQLEDKELKILVPGAGRSYEALYLWQQGFENVYVCDWAETAFDKLKNNAPDFPKTHVLVGDFFELEDTFDLIIEQTFFCALNPQLRLRYAQKMYELLSPSGKLVGLLFNIDFPFEGPPFGGSRHEYEMLFSKFFQMQIFETAYNSVPPRAGNELFFVAQKV